MYRDVTIWRLFRQTEHAAVCGSQTFFATEPLTNYRDIRGTPTERGTWGGRTSRKSPPQAKIFISITFSMFLLHFRCHSTDYPKNNAKIFYTEWRSTLRQEKSHQNHLHKIKCEKTLMLVCLVNLMRGTWPLGVWFWCWIGAIQVVVICIF
jgi:hypothetical protein